MDEILKKKNISLCMFVNTTVIIKALCDLLSKNQFMRIHSYVYLCITCRGVKEGGGRGNYIK